MSTHNDDMDDEVRLAQQMALAVASQPNLGASKAKELMIQEITHRSIHNNQKPVINPSSEDEEFQRAREMAMAVAALGKEQTSTVMKADDIRMAVANVMTESPSPQIVRKPKKAPIEKEKEEESTIPTTNDDDDDTTLRFEELFRPPWVLQNHGLLGMILVANALFLYVTISSEPSYTKLCNAFFVFHASLAILCLLEKQKVVDNTTKTQQETETTITEQQQKQKQQEQQLVDEMEKCLQPTIRLEWLSDTHFLESDLQSLAELQPNSTRAERRRFLKARKGVIQAASAQLGSYLEWRSQHKIAEFFPSTFTSDQNDWALAARGAMELRRSSASDSPTVLLPRIVSVFEDGLVVCHKGARIVHVLPSQLDTKLAPAKTYALALAMYLDRKLDRNHTEKVTVVIDIRSGKGWPNPSSVSLVPFIKLVVGSLNSYFPERLSRCILFPLPLTATVLFNKAKAYLDPDTATKIQVCSGTGSVKAKVPEEMKKFIDEKSLQMMEHRRKTLFLS